MSTGIRAIEDLRDRCWVDDITGCWHWKGGQPGRAPCLRLPDLDGRTTSIGAAICYLSTGSLPKRGQVWHVKCGSRFCANPEHRKCGTRRTQMLAAKYVPTPLTIAKISATKRQASGLTDEIVAGIREAEGPLSEIAARFGVSISHASRIRRLEQRRPVAAPGSSVFAMGCAR